MKRTRALVLVTALLAGFAFAGPQSAASEETVDMWTAATTGNLEAKSTGIRGSYFVNGEIHVNGYGTPEGKPLTSGHQDFKPSWSKTGDMLVFFRRLKHHPVTVNWNCTKRCPRKSVR